MNEEKRGRHFFHILHLCVYNAWLLFPILGNIQLSAFWSAQCNFKNVDHWPIFQKPIFQDHQISLKNLNFQPLFENQKMKNECIFTWQQGKPSGNCPLSKEQEVTGGITVPSCEKTQASLGMVRGGAPSPGSSHMRKEALGQLQTQLPKHCKSTRT